jgi:hypothetical protein
MPLEAMARARTLALRSLMPEMRRPPRRRLWRTSHRMLPRTKRRMLPKTTVTPHLEQLKFCNLSCVFELRRLGAALDLCRL